MFPPRPCCCCCSLQEREKLKLGPPETFHYLNQSSCYEIPGKNTNAVEYANTRRAMEVVGLTSDEQVGWERGQVWSLHSGGGVRVCELLLQGGCTNEQ